MDDKPERGWSAICKTQGARDDHRRRTGSGSAPSTLVEKRQ